mmetsp:Transcript_2304/g.3941  ORF Transcript_2304/g.3941 Transcript_2304/m.3941 type:complete len:337 (+) Transcript_2304:876-1886(+)
MNLVLLPEVHFPREDERRVEVDVVGHYDSSHQAKRCSESTFGDPRYHRSLNHFDGVGLGGEHVEPEGNCHNENEHPEEGLELPDAEVVDEEEEEGVEDGDDGAHPDGDAKENFERGGRANHLLDVRAYNGQLSHYPQNVPGLLRELLGRELGEVPLGDHADSGCNGLVEEPQNGGPQQSPDQTVLALDAGFEVSRDVAGVQVGNRHEEAGSDEAHELLPAEAEGLDLAVALLEDFGELVLIVVVFVVALVVLLAHQKLVLRVGHRGLLVRGAGRRLLLHSRLLRLYEAWELAPFAEGVGGQLGWLVHRRLALQSLLNDTIMRLDQVHTLQHTLLVI